MELKKYSIKFQFQAEKARDDIGIDGLNSEFNHNQFLFNYISLNESKQYLLNTCKEYM